MTTLVIVESPGKVKKITALLGAGYKVVASVGHVRDLPIKELGIEPPDFRLAYEPTDRGRGVLAKLRKEVGSAQHVILATDPDREGEAIAWHLADALGLKNPQRVTFSAITKSAIQSAIAAPRSIDMPRVQAQEARRALDRIVGYRVSPALSERSGQPLSAGRVQSPAVRLIVDREREIAQFTITTHFGAELTFSTSDGASWAAQWDTKPHLAQGEKYLLNDALARRVSEIRNVIVASIEDEERGQPPSAPFTTSSLQQVAGSRLKFKPKRVMDTAQRLYEQGAITYHRTDAPNMDAAGVEDISAYARGAGLPLTEKARKWKAKEGAQEGHEAIRPTHAADLEAGETDDERLLYRLIWQRAVASQLEDAMYAVRSVCLAGETDGQEVSFLATGRTLIRPGWRAIYANDAGDEDDEGAPENPVPALTVGEAQIAVSGRLLTKKTKPPSRFTQATLVAEMERFGIGRPSTYASILENITTNRGYATEGQKGHLVPSKIGETVRDALVGQFQFSELAYTRDLEEQLDQIAEGKADYHTVVAAAWESLDRELGRGGGIEIAVAHPCPDCGKALRRRKGQYGFFWSCSGYPACKTSMPDAKGKPGERKALPEPSGIQCPQCDKSLVRRQGVGKPKKGEKKGRPYDFFGCTGYPECNATYQTGSDGGPIFNIEN